MKKLFSILLALVMMFSLTVPAFADGPEGPPTGSDLWEWDYNQYLKDQWQEDLEKYPEETALFLQELSAWFAENWGGYYESWDEFVAEYGSQEAAYEFCFSDWLGDYQWEQAKNQFITDHGGVPGQLNVMLNGQYVKFPDAVPELTGGRTMVPFRAIFETLGAEVAYDGGEIHAVLGDTALDLAIGSDTMTKTVGGKTGTVKMDCAPYIKNNRTYVPVRFISEALGYDVQWDAYYKSAVITDLDALAEKIDKDFTIFNGLMAPNALTGKTRKTVGSGRADVTIFDTLNGDKNAQATCSYDLTAATAGASGKLEYDFSQLWALLEGYIPVPLDEDGAEDYAKTLELVKSLMKGSAEIRMDLEKGKVYLSMPGAFEAMGSYMEETGVQLPKDAWLSASLTGGAELDELIGMLRQPLTIGKLLSTTAGGASVSGYYSAEAYDNILEAADQFAKLFGDAKFSRKGSANVLTITKEDLAALVGEDDDTSESLDALSKFDFTLTVKDNGDMDVDYQARVALASSEISLGDFMDVSVKGSTRGGKTEETMEVHIKNVLKAAITLQQTVTETDKAPETTPPKDALVLPVDGTLPGGTVTSPDGPTMILP